MCEVALQSTLDGQGLSLYIDGFTMEEIGVHMDMSGVK